MAIGYKLFKIKKGTGQLFPLYVNANESIPIGVWVDAKNGAMKDGKVISKLGLLKYRPGWHINDNCPYVSHIGKKENGVIKYMHPDTVWAEVEYSDEIDYCEKAKAAGMINGKLNHKKACLDYVPVNGFYRYKTSPTMTGEWIIAGKMRINRIMSDDEVEFLCLEAGYEPLGRLEKINLREYGFAI